LLHGGRPLINGTLRKDKQTMAKIGYHCSHEQYPPSELLKNVLLAERSGFSEAMCSDHFHPWSERQGQSGYAWSWLGAALHATNFSLGVVNAPGQRYNPAVIAQAAATLSEMFPERLWLALGSGQALSEHITGTGWPPKPERNRRLLECVHIMRALWAGETVSHKGLVTVQDARIYSLPAKPPMLIGACLSPETAEWVGSWADGMITVAMTDRSTMREIIDAFQQGGGAGKPMFLQVAFSHAKTEAEALEAGFHEWRHVVLGMKAQGEIRSPREFDAACSNAKPDEFRKNFRVSASLEQHVEWLKGDIELGFERLFLHNVHRDQESFIRVFGEKVLPQLKNG
jgi:coenzyme F420-dependent glucose-6-phosphate dehydrogenase